MRVVIAVDAAENDDTHPPHIAPWSLFHAAVGMDNLFRGDKYEWTFRFTVISLTITLAPYSLLLPFSGTHLMTLRTCIPERGFHS